MPHSGRCWRDLLVSVESTARLLATGGDARILLDAAGVNRYGCPPRPDFEIAAFGSATASVISETGFAAADRLRCQLAAEFLPAPDLYARELDRVRRELLRLCALDDLPGLAVIFAASGTDAHLLAGQLVAAGAVKPPLAIMVEGAETGAGVAAALAGRHFSARTALGATVEEGTAIAQTLQVAAIPVRDGDGWPRSAAAIDADAERLATQAISQQRRVLLVLADVSKTGGVAPSPACVLALRERWPEWVEVLVDACQFRLSAANVRAYLERGCLLALTGSKFLTGPTFSGALLLPATVAERLRERGLPSGLGAYSARAEWPAVWPGAIALPEVANLGLLLRWEAALAELRAFRAVPEAKVTAFLEVFAAEIRARLAADPAFLPLPTPAPERGADFVAGWDAVPSVFPFLLQRGGRVVGREDLARRYQALRQNHIQLGQPVACGWRDGQAVAALRLCASARLVVEAADPRGCAAVLARAMAVLDGVAAV